MKSAQYIPDDLDDLDLDGWDEEAQEEEQVNDESSDEDNATDETTDSDDEEEEEVNENSIENSDNGNASEDNAQESDSSNSEDESQEEDEEEEEEDTTDLLADIIEHGTGAIDKIVEKKLAEKENELLAQQKEQEEVQASQQRFIAQAEALKDEVSDFEDVVNDDFFKEALEKPEVALRLFEAENNAKTAYVYAKTGVIFADEKIVDEQFEALKGIAPKEDSKRTKVPPIGSGGAFGTSTSSYSDIDEVGWE
jgi:hypothetical protein